MNALQLSPDNYDLTVTDGTLAIGPVTSQNQALILATHMGEWKESPTMGVGLADIAYDHQLEAWRRRITEAFEADGMRIDRLALTTESLTIEADYN